MSLIQIQDLDVVFSNSPKPALDLLDQGLSRDEIFKKTGLIVGVEKANLSGGARRNLRADGLVGLGQIQPAALHQRPQHREPWQAADRARRCSSGHRQLLGRPDESHAHAAHRHGVPEVRTHAVVDRGGEREPGPGNARPAQRRAQKTHRRQARTRGLEPVARQAARRALRRHAAARGPGPCARHGRRHPADGRAVLRARPADPPRPARRAAGPATPAEHDHRVREPRSGRSPQAGQQHRDHEGWPDRSAQQARRHRAATRPTITCALLWRTPTR